MAKRDLVRLLVRLFGDPKQVERLNKSPEKVMKAARLSPAERKLLASGDERAIRAYLGRDVTKANLDRAGLSDIVKTSASDIVRTSISDIVKTSVSDIVKTSISDIVKTSISDIVKTSISDIVKTSIRSKKPGGKPKKK